MMISTSIPIIFQYFFCILLSLFLCGCQPETPDVLAVDRRIWTPFKLEKFRAEIPSVYQEDQLIYSSDTTPERNHDGQLLACRYPFYKSFYVWLSHVTRQSGGNANIISFQAPTITLKTYHNSIKSQDTIELRCVMTFGTRTNKKTINSACSEIIPSNCSLEYRSYIEQKLFYTMLADLHAKISVILRGM